MTTTIRTEVAVVGAGPVGLALAGELRLAGAAVLVVEQLAAPTTESRASTLHARTMELLDSRGLLDRFGTLPGQPQGHFGGIPLDLTLPGPWPGQWKVPQTRTEEVLQDWARSLGADIRRGHAVREVTVAEDHVEAVAVGPGGPVRIRAEYLVGCDGEDSTVRRLVGADFPGTDAERELLRADVAGVEIPDRRFQRLERGFAVAARRADGVTRVMVHEFDSTPRYTRPGAGAPEFGEIADAWKRVTGEDISGGTPLWVNAFGDANRQLSAYRHGRVLFAGDAAHRQLPVGGQALNLGLQDAFNLGWKLGRQVRGEAPAGLLDSYHSERHAVGRRTLGNIKAQAMLLLGGPDVEAARAVFGELIALEGTRRHLAGMISGVDVRYDVGPGDHPLLGARLPQLTLATTVPGQERTTTTVLLRTGRGLLLDLTGDEHEAARIRAAAEPWAGRVDVVAGRPEPDGAEPSGADQLGPGLFLVRPDGHLAWAGDAGADPRPALHRCFGEPAA
ncbi:FAD-dependent monooxygenase [Streptomyces sp. NPDC053069]|uniref:FAD-dependent monooxygenase n=1 Tax=Streptomyces sp. NPDC053069 TaxID=3365695 RepID=UPI0037D8A37C